MKKIKIKNLTLGDIEDILRVEEESWEPDLRADKETFIERLQRYPKGFLGAYVDDKLAGMTYAHPIIDVENTWYGNSCKEILNLKGKVWYIVNVGVSKNYRGLNVGSKLLNENKKHAKLNGFKEIVLGARNIESNVNFYTKNGFIQVEKIKDYFPEDKESKGYGIIMKYSL